MPIPCIAIKGCIGLLPKFKIISPVGEIEPSKTGERLTTLHI